MNPEQLAASTYTGGPMRILAGAGTGKTQTLTARFVFLVEDASIGAHEILALTFSRKAAEEMRRRVLAELSGGYRELHIQTFHAFCLDLVTEWRRAEGLGKLQLLSDDDRRWFAHKVVAGIPLTVLRYYRSEAARWRFATDLLTLADRAKEHLIGPERIDAYAAAKNDDSGRLDDLALAFHDYQARLYAEHKRDYGDLAMEVVRRLRDEPALLHSTRARFRHLLVDEFQDTNEAQHQLVQLLTPEGGHVCVVGDPNQAIYAFRGGKPEYIRHFCDAVPGAVTFPLTKNYRSTPEVLEPANALIRSNQEPDYFELVADRASSGARVTVTEAATTEHEAELIARRILAIVRRDDSPRAFGEIAILVRSLKTSEAAIANALAANAIPYRIGKARAAGYEVVQDLLAALRLVIGPPAWADAARLAAARGANAAAMRSLEGRLSGDQRDRMLTSAPTVSTDLTPDESAALSLARQIATAAASYRDLPLPELAYGAMTICGHLHATAPAEAGRFLSAVLERAVRLSESDATAQAFLDQMVAGYDADDDEAPGDPHGVQLLTVHAAKGLEWPVVFVAGVANDLFPVPMRLDRDFDLDELGDWSRAEDLSLLQSEDARAAAFLREERRLMYVALTRGKDEVHLTVPRMLGAKRLEPSVFISEMGLGDPAASDTPTDAPPASMAELATALRARRQRALAARIDAADAPEHLASLLLSQWAATGKVAGALPLRDRLIPEPFGSGKPLRFSFSRLSTYEACPRRFLYESVLGLESDEESASGAFGSAVHAALSTLNAGWRRSGEPPDDAAIDAVIAETWPESGFDFKAQREQLRMRARAMLRRYYAWERGQPLSRRPIEIESPIQAAYGAHTFTGRVDLMLEREDGEIEIVDFKTGSQSRIDKPAESMQLYLYDHAWRAREADRAPRVSFYALKHAEDKGFRAGERWDDAKQNRGHQHNESSAAAIREKIDGLLAGILADDFTPTPGEACGFCPCRWLCPEGSAV